MLRRRPCAPDGVRRAKPWSGGSVFQDRDLHAAVAAPTGFGVVVVYGLGSAESAQNHLIALPHAELEQVRGDGCRSIVRQLEPTCLGSGERGMASNQNVTVWIAPENLRDPVELLLLAVEQA